MKVLIADKVHGALIEKLGAHGFEVTYNPSCTGDELVEETSGHNILVVRSTKVSAEVLTQSASLQMVIRAGAGVNTIDVETAASRGIFVCNCPGKNAIATAELTIGLVFALDRRIPMAHQSLKEGQWAKKNFSKADGVFGKKYGVIGCGMIGTEVAKRARALGCEVLVWSRSMTSECAAQFGAHAADSMEQVARECDIISVHLAYCEQTAGCIDAAFLQNLKPDTMLINTCRGGVVDEQAVLEAMENNGLRYATDVFDDEPGSKAKTFENTLAQHPDVVCTPHIGASTTQAQHAVAMEVLHIIETYATTSQAVNCVNRQDEASAPWTMTVRHLNRVGVLASILDAVRRANINVEELENIIFSGGVAACASIRLSNQPDAPLIDAVSELEHILHVRAVQAS